MFSSRRATSRNLVGHTRNGCPYRRPTLRGWLLRKRGQRVGGYRKQGGYRCRGVGDTLQESRQTLTVGLPISISTSSMAVAFLLDSGFLWFWTIDAGQRGDRNPAEG